jgi:hypothetical protein
LEFTLYIGSKKAKHAIEYTFSKYACTRLSRAKKYNLEKTPRRPRSHTKWEELKVVQIISKNQLNTRLTPKSTK